MHALIASALGLLVSAIFVALVAHRLKLPYTVGLVFAGIGIALSPFHSGIVLTQDFIFELILPALLFEAAINIHWRDLRQDGFPIMTLAVLGTVIAAGVVAAGARYALHWPMAASALFGVLIAATDPVAVIAMFKDNGVKGRIRLLVESESLLNDGVAAVLFSLVMIWAQAAGDVSPGWGIVFHSLLVKVGGGVLIGLMCAAAVVMLVGRTADHLVESVLTTVAAYGSFIVAEQFHSSGVLATVAAGLVIGNVGILAEHDHGPMSSHGRTFALELWDFIAFVANSIVFLLIGITVSNIRFSQLGYGTLAGIVALVLAGRALSVYPLATLFRGSRWRMSAAEQHILWWGGLRGALGLALALSLDPTLPMRNQIVVATFSVVIFSVVVEGLTMPMLLRRLKFLPGQA